MEMKSEKQDNEKKFILTAVAQNWSDFEKFSHGNGENKCCLSEEVSI